MKSLTLGFVMGVFLLVGTSVFSAEKGEPKIAEEKKDKGINVSEKEMKAFLKIYPMIKNGNLNGNDLMSALRENSLKPTDFTALTNKISKAYACCKAIKMKEAVLNRDKNKGGITVSENLEINGENVSLSRNTIEIVNKYLPQLDPLFETAIREDGTGNGIQDKSAEKKPEAGVKKLSIGDDAPEVSVSMIGQEGKTFSIADNRDRVIVLEFWATCCPPCCEIIPHLSKLQKQHGDKVVIVGISREGKDVVEKFRKERKDMDYIVATDNDNKTNSLYPGAVGVNWIPYTFIITNGKILWHGHPMLLDKELEKAVGASGKNSVKK